MKYNCQAWSEEMPPVDEMEDNSNRLLGLIEMTMNKYWEDWISGKIKPKMKSNLEKKELPFDEEKSEKTLPKVE
jgi:hypothetical protein